MPQYQVEALRTIRTLQAQHETAGHTAQAEQMRKIGDQVEAMQTELFDWQERANEHANNSAAATTELIGLRAELAALKEAARLLIITTQPVLGEDGHLWITEHAVGKLAALVEEE